MRGLHCAEDSVRRQGEVRTAGEAGAGCEICGSAQILLDEVQQGGTLYLAECGRCENRWTWRRQNERSNGATSLTPVSHSPPPAPRRRRVVGEAAA